MADKRKRPAADTDVPAPKRKAGPTNDKRSKVGKGKELKLGTAGSSPAAPSAQRGSARPSAGAASARKPGATASSTTKPKAGQQAAYSKKPKEASNKPYGGTKKHPPADGKTNGGKPAKDKDAPKAASQSSSIVKRALLQDTVQKWEAIRRHDLAKGDRAPLVSAVLAEAKGRLAQLAVSHTGSRVVQACVKFGTPEERALVLAELRPSLLELAKSSYAHFTVTKLIALAPKADVQGLVKSLLPEVAHLLRHPCGASVVSALYDRASAEQRNAMAATFYGKEFSVLSQGPYPASLSDLLKATESAMKRQAILQQLTLKVHPIMEKAMVDAVLVHRLLAEYLQHSQGSAVADAVEQLAGPAVLRIIHTQHGAYVGCAVFAYGTAKDRKKAIKSMKGHVPTIAKDGWAHVVLMAALTFTDDTALLRKYIIADLLGSLEELCQHRHGSRVLLHLLRPLCSKYMPPQELSLLTLEQRTRRVPASQVASADEAAEEGPEAADEDPEGGVQEAPEEAADADPESPGGLAAAQGGLKDEEHEEQVELVDQVLGASKKLPGVRRAEVLGSGLGSLAGRLVHLCTAKAGQLLRHPVGSSVLLEVAMGGEGGLLGDAEELAPLHEAILESCRAPWPAEDHILEDWHASRAIRALCQAAGPSASQAAQRLSAQLWDQVLERKDAEALLQSHCGKIVHACCHSGDAALKAKALAKFPQIPAAAAAPRQLDGRAKRLQQKEVKKLQKKGIKPAAS